MRQLIILIIIICSYFSIKINAQIGINTNTPQGIVDINSSNSALILSRNATPSSNVTSPVEGMVLYNSTQKALNVHNGSGWQQVIYYQSNEGVVKINSGGAGQTKPSLSLTNGGAAQTINYTLPLNYASSPTTSWPENNPSGDAYIYNSSVNRFLENALLGQTHFWRVIAIYSKGILAGNSTVTMTLTNPVSGFQLQQSLTAPASSTTGTLVFYFITVADGASLPPPNGTGNGYAFQATADGTITLSIDSVTRISLKKDS